MGKIGEILGASPLSKKHEILQATNSGIHGIHNYVNLTSKGICALKRNIQGKIESKHLSTVVTFLSDLRNALFYALEQRFNC